MSKENKTEFLFNIYSANLQMYHSNLRDIFICPICFGGYSRDAIASKEITREHIIPSKLSGRLETLTCKSCNNKRGGSDVESHLVRRFRTEDILAGKSNSPLRSKIKIGEGEFGADVYLSENGPNIRIDGIPKISNPKLLSRAMKAFEAGTTNFGVSASLGYKDIPSRIAVLRIAYLLMFHYFGYGYALYKHLDKIREQILNPNNEADVMKGIIKLRSKPTTKSMVTIVIEPKELRCFFVILDLSTKINRYFGVVLPGFDDQNETIYERWANLGDEGIRNLNSNSKIIPYVVEYKKDPHFNFLPHKLWKHFFELNQ